MYQLFEIDDKFLADLGLANISVEEKQQVVDGIRVALEAKVGIKLSQGLSGEQLDQFSNILSGNDPKVAMDWMEKNIPNYRDIVMQELDAIIKQIKQNNLSFIKQL